MDFHGTKSLQELREALVELLSAGTWDQIQLGFDEVELGWRKDLGPGHGKPAYVRRVLVELTEPELHGLARKCIEVHGARASLDVQNAVWRIEASGVQGLSVLTRRKLAQALDGYRMHPYHGPAEFVLRYSPLRHQRNRTTEYSYSESNSLFCRTDEFLTFLSEAPKTPWAKTSHLQLLEEVGFLAWPDQRVIEFLDSLVHPETRVGDEQLDLIRALEEIVKPDGFVSVVAGRVSGHDVYCFQRRAAGDFGKPKNLIFASTGPKPEIGFADAINNDIVVLKNAEYCLVYDQELSEDGLTWQQLVVWWAKARGQDPDAEEVRKELGRRLRSSTSYPAERAFFDAYVRHVRPNEGRPVPALLPQVYLHYDPITHAELYRRGEGKRFSVQRMDFLLLLPRNARVVIEIDGAQHYSEAGTASPRKYAETMESGRELQLAGYEVYRFAGYELTERPASETVGPFVDLLLRRHSEL